MRRPHTLLSLVPKQLPPAYGVVVVVVVAVVVVVVNVVVVVVAVVVSGAEYGVCWPPNPGHEVGWRK